MKSGNTLAFGGVRLFLRFLFCELQMQLDIGKTVDTSAYINIHHANLKGLHCLHFTLILSIPPITLKGLTLQRPSP